MTRKDYIKIAEVIDTARQSAYEAIGGQSRGPDDLAGQAVEIAISKVVTGMAQMLAADNPLFQSGRFLAACGE